MSTKSEQSNRLLKTGAVSLENIIRDELITQALAEFNDKYLSTAKEYDQRANSDAGHPVNNVGDNRYLIGIELSGALGDPQFYANPDIVGVIRDNIGENAVLASYGVVLSLPGAKTQHLHRDGPQLFNLPISHMLPAYAVTVMMPLVDMNGQSGSTTILPNSHNKPFYHDTHGEGFEETEKLMASGEIENFAPEIKTGSCAIWDYRTYHRGNANISDAPRPVLCATYCAPWFNDKYNWGKGGNRNETLIVPDGFLETVPKPMKTLFELL